MYIHHIYVRTYTSLLHHKDTTMKTILILLILVLTTPTYAWHDFTHTAIAISLGDYAFTATAPDAAKIKAPTEGANHYRNNPYDHDVTSEDVTTQAPLHDTLTGHSSTGCLYGSILASTRTYQARTKEGKYAMYHLGYVAHYVGDLAMPLHNTIYDDFNKKNHKAFDAVLETICKDNPDVFKDAVAVSITTEAELITEICKLANKSIKLASLCKEEDRTITEAEATTQCTMATSLLKGICVYVGYTK